MKKIISFLLFLSLSILLLITFIDVFSFDADFYEEEFRKSETASRINTSEENLLKMRDTLFSYLKDEKDTLNLRLMVDGEVKEVFSERAKLHMKDVKKLYQEALSCRNILLMISAFLSFLLFILHIDAETLFVSYKKTLVVLGTIFSGIGCFACIDFNTFWIGFHEIFFDNDLYFLAYDDVLVNLVNDQFFFDLVLKIVIVFLLSLVLIYFFLWIFKRRCENENKRCAL